MKNQRATNSQDHFFKKMEHVGRVYPTSYQDLLYSFRWCDMTSEIGKQNRMENQGRDMYWEIIFKRKV